MTPVAILGAVARARGVPVYRLRGPARDCAHVSTARHEAMFLLRELLHLSYPAIARALWRWDHTTAMHAVRKIGASAMRNPVYAAELLAMVGK